MKIALTGAGGKLGQAILPMALAESHQVVAIDRRLPELPEGVAGHNVEMSDYEGLVSAFSGCDALIHMAAIPSPRGLLDHQVHANNVVGSYNAMRAAVDAGISRICQGSSVNAIGLAYAKERRFDYFPVDELHPPYFDEGYSLSKWICEQQAESLTRRFPDLQIASLRFHWVVADRAEAMAAQTLTSEKGRIELWGYVLAPDAARACLLALTTSFTGHEVFYIVADDTTLDSPTAEAAAAYYPDVAWRNGPEERAAFFSNAKSRRILGWAPIEY
ncbi:NAD-dependent epimerase/dehydratase family protein [Pararhizobium sp. DWP3-4]|uniref:NAD-dependent epimerase/dehydratase family protein n=1 Tax=Pararhizobium sp. DWP3-4 TaxID=2804565 RepID=UPI003CF8C3E5